jgi:DNA-directed RNA polymerase sigma subunit (sigma70/sigma32)
MINSEFTAEEKLTKHEKKILSMRFQDLDNILTSQSTNSLNDIAKHFGFTSARVRQIEAKAVRIARKEKQNNDFNLFMNGARKI